MWAVGCHQVSCCQVGRKVCGESVVTKCPVVRWVVKSVESRLSSSVLLSGGSYSMWRVGCHQVSCCQVGRKVCGESVVIKCPVVRWVVKYGRVGCPQVFWCQVGRKVCGESVVTKCPAVR